MFANPGSTEVPFLAGLPDDFRFVLGLHEGSRRRDRERVRDRPRRARARPAAHDRRARQRGERARDRAGEPRAARRRGRPAGPPPPRVRAVPRREARGPRRATTRSGVDQPARAQDVPAAIERAFHAATTRRGPALVIVPMGDWVGAGRRGARAGRGRRCASIARGSGAGGRRRAGGASSQTPRSPALVVGAGADDAETWSALVDACRAARARPSSRSRSAARAGFPQDHPLFAGRAARRPRRGSARRWRRTTPVLVVGAPVFRQTRTSPGPLDRAGNADRVRQRRPGRGAPQPGRADGPGAARGRLPRAGRPRPRPRRLAAGPARAAACAGAARARRAAARPSHVLAALAERLPREAIVLEEAPVDRPDLHARLPAREPLGYPERGEGGLGFAIPAAVGLRMALPDRPVVAVVGDGSRSTAIQALWSAAHYERRRALRGPLERRLRGHGPPRREARRGAPRGRVRRRSTSRAGRARLRLPRAPDRRRTTSSLSALDEVVPALADLEEPLAPRRRSRADDDLRPVTWEAPDNDPTIRKDVLHNRRQWRKMLPPRVCRRNTSWHAQSTGEPDGAERTRDCRKEEEA